jgi:hypothetical protein
MQPVVHGLEQEYGGRVDFLYLDVADERNREAMQRLGFTSTPHFFVLRPDGSIVWEHSGILTREALEARILDVDAPGPMTGR